MASKTKKPKESVAHDRRSLDEIGKTASQVIQEAASVLEEELATGLIAARKVSRRLATEQRFETEDFDEVLKRFRSTGHELIEVARDRIEELGSDTTQELSQRFLNDAQGALDVIVDLIESAPELADQLLKRDAPVSEENQQKPSKKANTKSAR